MARLAGIDLPRNKRMEVALTYIYGIGRTTSKEILAKANVDFNRKSDDLTEDEIRIHQKRHRQRIPGRR